MATALNGTESEAAPVSVAGVRDIVLVGSGKGGVGKSTIAVNLAVSLAEAGTRTGIVDLDLSGPSVARLTGTGAAPDLGPDGLAVPRERHGLHVISVADMIPPEQAVAWKGPLIAQAVEQLIREVAWPDLDVLVVDLPPGTGDVLLSVVEQIPVTGVVVVTTPEKMATIDAERAVALFHEHDIPVFGIVRNMETFICPCCGEEQKLYETTGSAKVAKKTHVADLGSIPADPGAARQAAEGVPIAVADPDGAMGRAFAGLARSVHQAITRDHAAARHRSAEDRTIWDLIHND